MPSLKSTLIVSARLMRWTAFCIENWYWLLLVACVVSPVSPHVRLPYQLTYAECDYIGTRGVVSKVGDSCDLIEIIDTRDVAARWSL